MLMKLVKAGIMWHQPGFPAASQNIETMFFPSFLMLKIHLSCLRLAGCAACI